ncbi:cell wall / vacuolar inhibitor of fructosidase 2-like [Juglans regia]|uniref:Cell wall / vacuolar inhibitor of fructosidase 2-like n=1 Tax=Juglans regia TaxID=51240 RepID=A0A2I4GIJ9_JUGRE|nr:cell wall / vacuolar inhibitor of fructosidase 2-like [Juglans regia]
MNFTYAFLRLIPLFFSLMPFIVHPSYAATTNPTDLVLHVCRRTSDYSFCVESLYSDLHTPGADAYQLAYVSFRLAYLNATGTQHHIATLLKHSSSPGQSQRLRQCSRDYKKATFALERAYNDLDSETFFELADFAGVAAHAAADCQAATKGTYSSLAVMNKNLKGLSEICNVVSKLFSAS